MDKNSAKLLPTRTMIPRTIPHYDNSQPGTTTNQQNPLIRTNTCMVGNCPGGELSGYAGQLPTVQVLVLEGSFS